MGLRVEVPDLPLGRAGMSKCLLLHMVRSCFNNEVYIFTGPCCWLSTSTTPPTYFNNFLRGVVEPILQLLTIPISWFKIAGRQSVYLTWLPITAMIDNQ